MDEKPASSLCDPELPQKRARRLPSELNLRPQPAGSANFLLIQSWALPDPEPCSQICEPIACSVSGICSTTVVATHVAATRWENLVCSTCVVSVAHASGMRPHAPLSMLAQEAPLHFRADDSRVDYHWCAPDDDVCKRWEQNDGLATKPQDSDAGWTVWCFCGERMQLFSSEEPCRLELSCTCRICGKFAQTGLRFIATGDDIWHCATCGATEQTKKGSREPLGRPGSPELRMLREQGHVLLECVRMSLGKDAAYKALGQHFHFGQSGVADTVRAIHALRQIVPKQSDASLRVSAQKRRLLRLQDDDSSCRALASELKEDMSQDVKDTLLFGFANAGHASLLRLLLEARCSANVQRTKDGCSPLHCALVHGRHDAANVLVAHGASRALRNNAGERPDDLATS